VRAVTAAVKRAVVAPVVRAVTAAGVRAVNAANALVGPGLIHFFCTSFLQYFLLPRAHIGLFFLFHICGGQGRAELIAPLPPCFPSLKNSHACVTVCFKWQKLKKLCVLAWHHLWEIPGVGAGGSNPG
jgi:hypothetical protein